MRFQGLAGVKMRIGVLWVVSGYQCFGRNITTIFRVEVEALQAFRSRVLFFITTVFPQNAQKYEPEQDITRCTHCLQIIYTFEGRRTCFRM
jgi:hypothetical protein